jgi:hypothetical protein
MAAGRPPLPRNVFSFESRDCPIPELVTLDTSFVVNALLSGESHHGAALQFLQVLAENDTWLVYSHLLELELREVAFRLPIRDAYPKDWRRRRHDGRTLRRARRLIAETMGAWEQLLTAFAYAIIQVDAVYDRVPELMDRHGSRPSMLSTLPLPRLTVGRPSWQPMLGSPRFQMSG